MVFYHMAAYHIVMTAFEPQVVNIDSSANVKHKLKLARSKISFALASITNDIYQLNPLSDTASTHFRIYTIAEKIMKNGRICSKVPFSTMFSKLSYSIYHFQETSTESIQKEKMVQ